MDIARLQKIQGELARHGMDGWLIYDFHGSNDIATRFLKLSGIITRRSFYLIPASGPPKAFVHAIEKKPFESLPGEKFYYSSYRILEEELRRTLEGKKRLAMEYSPRGRLPYIGKVDAGTLELIRSFGIEVVSSANLVAKFDACLDGEQIALHREAAGHLYEIKDAFFEMIRGNLAAGRKTTEYDIVCFIMESFDRAGMVTDVPPICAFGANGGNPHYVPTETSAAEITRDGLVLVDFWAKMNKPRSVFADITWMAYTGSDLPERYHRHFELICKARDAAVAYLEDAYGRGKVYGFQVDDVCRAVIAGEDLSGYFTHRTGHSIAEEVHGPGPNIDNLETEDRRQLMPGHLFSIEPGLYFTDYGLRSEIDVLITGGGPEVTTQPLQKEIVLLY